MAILKEIRARNGTYRTQSGEEKTSYLTIGKLIETKNGPAIKIDSIPMNWDGWAYMQDPKPADGSKPAAPQQQSAPGISGDEIPF